MERNPLQNCRLPSRVGWELSHGTAVFQTGRFLFLSPLTACGTASISSGLWQTLELELAWLSARLPGLLLGQHGPTGSWKWWENQLPVLKPCSILSSWHPRVTVSKASQGTQAWQLRNLPNLRGKTYQNSSFLVSK